mgnify:CR=1 FL=1
MNSSDTIRRCATCKHWDRLGRFVDEDDDEIDEDLRRYGITRIQEVLGYCMWDDRDESTPMWARALIRASSGELTASDSGAICGAWGEKHDD